MSNTDSTSSSLIGKARAQEAGAWQRLVSVCTPLVRSWCRQGGVASNDTDDLVQEVLAAVAKNLSGFRKEKPTDTFRGWLRVITRNKLNDYFRKENERIQSTGGTGARLQMEQVPDVTTDEDHSISGEQEKTTLYQSALELVRNEFEEQTWKAFWEATINGRTSTDIAGELGMSPGAVRQAKYKVLQKLRSEMGDLLE